MSRHQPPPGRIDDFGIARRPKARWAIVLLLMLAVAAVGAWLWLSPYWTLRTLQNAVREGDARTVSAHVDYPAVRASLRTEVQSWMARDSDGSPLGNAGRALAGQLADPAIEAMVTPHGMQMLLGRAGLATATFDAGGDAAPSQMRLDHDAIDRFIVRPQQQGSPTLEFRLRGFRWMLTGIALNARG